MRKTVFSFFFFSFLFRTSRQTSDFKPNFPKNIQFVHQSKDSIKRSKRHSSRLHSLLQQVGIQRAKLNFTNKILSFIYLK
ncbi:hypothetical protein AQUCO_01300075v1 [Aquilegia coerulea]|uniref:Secreted protein n=1 Tax=Aquilegia coerulea TaxID=218851 RepID=A0A2G5DZQ8_AQUCA|nr:hypothetical protein AQUCO_01300075v1 [Aquilegia coerulea]